MADAHTTGLLGYLVPTLHWLAAVPVLAEGLNKLERTHPREPGLCLRARVIVVMKSSAWVMLSFAAGLAMARPLVMALANANSLRFGPFLIMNRPSLMDVLVLLGFALLIVRSRLKEKLPGHVPEKAHHDVRSTFGMTRFEESRS